MFGFGGVLEFWEFVWEGNVYFFIRNILEIGLCWFFLLVVNLYFLFDFLFFCVGCVFGFLFVFI